MSKQAGGSRTSRPTKISGVGSSPVTVASLANDVSKINTLDAQQTKEMMARVEETVRAIVEGGGLAGEGWTALENLRNRNEAFEHLGSDKNKPEAIQIVNQLNMRATTAGRLSIGDVFTDGTSVYTVQRVNKDGSIRGAHTDYERRPSTAFSSGYRMVPRAETIKLGKNERVTRFGNDGAAIDYQKMYEGRLYRLRSK